MQRKNPWAMLSASDKAERIATMKSRRGTATPSASTAAAAGQGVSTLNSSFKPVMISGNRYLVNLTRGNAYHRHKNGSIGNWAGIFSRTPKPYINTSVPESNNSRKRRMGEVNLLGLNTQAPARKSNNLLTFPSHEEELASINFSKGATNTVNFKKFTNAGINIEEETVKMLSPNMRTSLFNRLTRVNKRNQNAEINSFLQNILTRKGGKRKSTRKHKRRHGKTRKH
jgi:hypothetical protein